VSSLLLRLSNSGRPALRLLAIACAFLLGTLRLQAQSDYAYPYSWQTIAGWAPFGFEDGTGAAALFSHPGGIAIARSGNLYLADSSNCVIRRITPSGVVTTLAGMPGENGHADGIGSAARFQYPGGLCVDDNEVLYVADGSQTIRRVTSSGVVTTIAGQAWVNGSADGPALSASFWNMGGLTIDASGTLYIVDGSNLTIRKLQGGTVSTIAGSPNQWGGTDGNGAAARFYYPNSIAVDSSGNLFVTDAYGQTVRKITPAGDVSTFAGLFNHAGTADGTGAAARFHNPAGITIDASGTLFLTDSGSNTIRSISAAGLVSTFAGTHDLEGSADGTGAAARFAAPGGITVDSSGYLYVADTYNSTVRRISPSAAVTTLAGTAAPQDLWADGSARAARFFSPWGLVLDSSGNAYLTDQLNHVVRRLSASGQVTTLAGSPGVPGTQDGPAASAAFNQPAGIARSANGDLYVADSGSHTIRLITASGTVSTFAGSAGLSGSVDGPAASARFNTPAGLAFDNAGRLHVADSGNHTIRIIDTSGTVSTLAGLAGTSGERDGPRSIALLNSPQGLAFDSDGSLLVADAGNASIRRITPFGEVATLAGSRAGQMGARDGYRDQAQFYFPQGIAVDAEGYVYVADTYNNLIRRISPQGRVSSLGGAEEINSSQDGSGAASRFATPVGLAIDAAGRLWVADSYNNTLRRGSAVSSLRADFSGVSTSGIVGGSLILSANVRGGNVPYAFHWYLNDSPLSDSASVSGSASSTLALSPVALSQAGHYALRVTDSAGNAVFADMELSLSSVTLGLLTAPADLSVEAGGTASFSISASGTGQLRYQWSKDGVPLSDGSGISGSTSATLGLSVVGTGQAGVYSVLVRDSYGHQLAAQANLTVTTNVPFLTAQPLSQSVAAGGSVSFSAAASGSGPLVYQWTLNGADLAGANAASLSLTGVQVSASGSYRLRVSNGAGSVLSDAAFLTVTSDTGGPGLQSQPQSFSLASGSSVVLSVDGSTGQVRVSGGMQGLALASTQDNYQWFLDGVALADGNGITGARSATLLLRGAAARSGAYTCLVSNATASVLSKAAALAVSVSADPGRLMNLSTRALVGSGGSQLITGFACSNETPTAAQPVLIRAIGPTLSAFGLEGVLKTAALTVQSSGLTLATNTGWNGDAAVSAAALKVGAFALADAKSADSALLLGDMPAAATSALVSGSNGESGLALVEVYDATATTPTGTGSRHLMNLSARGFVGTGAQKLIAGLVIGGSTAKTVLLRASGPALAAFGLSGTLPDPQIELFSGNTTIATNKGWNAQPQIITVANAVGAFSWGNQPSADAALLLTLQPGAYTLVVSGASGDTGLALVEVYDVP